MSSRSSSSLTFLARIESQDGYHLNQECRKGGKYATLEIDECKILSIWLGHGLWSFFGSFITSPTVGEALTHWWVQIKTKNGSYFILLWGGDGIGLYPCRNEYDATRLGQCAASGVSYNDSKSVTRKKYWSPRYKCTLADVYHWATKQDSEYNMVTNNCKHIAQNFYNESTLYDLGNRED